MTYTSKIELSFDRQATGDIQYYRVYRKRGAVPDRLSSELAFVISQPLAPENVDDRITRVDSELPQVGISYDPLEQVFEVDPRGAKFKIAIDDTRPIPATNLFVIPDPSNNGSDIGGILISWSAAVAVGTIWGYDITAVDAGGLESPEGADLDATETSKLETVNIGLADGVVTVPSEYPQAGKLFHTYLIEGGSEDFYVDTQTSIVDTNNGTGFDTEGPMGVTAHSAVGNFPVLEVTLHWSEALKSVGTDQSSRSFRVIAFTRAGYSSQSTCIPGPDSVICPITNGQAGLKITRLDATRWHDGVTIKTLPPPTPEVFSAPVSLPGIVTLNHGSIIRGSVFVTNSTDSLVYIEDSGTYASPAGDGDYIIDYSRINGATDIQGRVKILSGGNIVAGQVLHIQYKYGRDYGTSSLSSRPLLTDPQVGPYDGTVWSGTGPEEYIDTDVEALSAYNYAWYVTDNAGRVTQGTETKFAQAILEDVEFPEAIQGFKVEAVLKP